MRVLVAGRPGVPAVVAHLEAAADRMGAAGRPGKILIERRLEPLLAGLGAPTYA